jgi:hypothetical protein
MARRREVLLIAVLALVVAVPLSRAQEAVSHARIVYVSHTEGTAQLNGQPVPMNSPVTEGAALVTGTDGLAEVQFEDGSVVRLASETKITFAQLARLSSGEAITRVDLDQGEAEFHVMGRTGQFAVEAGGKNIQFKGSGRYRIVTTHLIPLEVAVWSGEAAVRDKESGQQVAVNKNETFTLSPTDRDKYTLESSVFGDDLDQWSDIRDQALSSTPVNSNYSYASSAASYLPTYGFSSFGFDSCFGQPFWYAAPGYCSGFYNPWFFGFNNPFFFSPPVVFVVTPPARPRRFPPIHPPTPPAVAGVARAPAAVRPGVRSFRLPGGPLRVFNEPNVNDGNVQSSFSRAGSTPPAGTARAGEQMPKLAQAPVSSVQRVTSPPVEPLITPGQRSAGNVSAVPPARVTQAAPPVQAPRPSAPAAPPRPSSPPRSFSAPPSAPHGVSGPSFSHSSGPSSHSGGSGPRR